MSNATIFSEVLFGFYRVSLLTLAIPWLCLTHLVGLRIAKVNLVTGTQDSST